MVATADFPQADRLEQVGRVAIAIAKGNQADEEIEAFIGLDSNARQGALLPSRGGSSRSYFKPAQLRCLNPTEAMNWRRRVKRSEFLLSFSCPYTQFVRACLFRYHMRP